MCHGAAAGTSELVGDGIDHCPILYLIVGIQLINFVNVTPDRPSLPEFVNLQVCAICAVMVSIR